MLVSISILITPLGVNLAIKLFIILLIRTAYHVGSWSNLLFILLSRAAIVESQQRNWHYFIKYYLNAMPPSQSANTNSLLIRIPPSQSTDTDSLNSRLAATSSTAEESTDGQHRW